MRPQICFALPTPHQGLVCLEMALASTGGLSSCCGKQSSPRWRFPQQLCPHSKPPLDLPKSFEARWLPVRGPGPVAVWRQAERHVSKAGGTLPRQDYRSGVHTPLERKTRIHGTEAAAPSRPQGACLTVQLLRVICPLCQPPTATLGHSVLTG